MSILDLVLLNIRCSRNNVLLLFRRACTGMGRFILETTYKKGERNGYGKTNVNLRCKIYNHNYIRLCV